jgi:hypothetical protein
LSPLEWTFAMRKRFKPLPDYRFRVRLTQMTVVRLYGEFVRQPGHFFTKKFLKEVEAAAQEDKEAIANKLKSQPTHNQMIKG